LNKYYNKNHKIYLEIYKNLEITLVTYKVIGLGFTIRMEGKVLAKRDHMMVAI
jgi:hypothetical protein